MRGDGKDRAFVEETLCFLLRVIFRVALPDANAPYRLMKRELLEKYVGRFEDDYNVKLCDSLKTHLFTRFEI